VSTIADPRSNTAAPSSARLRFLVRLDSGLLLALIALEAPRGTGLSVHEWLGMFFALAVSMHLLVNWQWIVQTLRKILKPRRGRDALNLVLNGSLFVCMTFTVVSGLRISEIVLPLAGIQPSPFIPWHKVHKLFSMLSVGIVGLHLGLNWDWIVAAMRKRLSARNTDSSEALSTQFGSADFFSICRRLAVLIAAVIAVSAMCFLLVGTTDANNAQRARRERFSKAPEPGSLPQESGVQLLVVIAAAVVGKKVLRLRL